jgi:hypothetical protein
VGTRVAARLLREKAARAAAESTERAKRSAPVYAERGRRLADGSQRLGRSIWRPFAKASRVLWLEITGLFFAIFALFFGSNLWRLRAGWQQGPTHREFVLYALCTAIFLYFTVSSFVRASRHKKS